MHILIQSRSQQLLKVDSLLNPVSLSPLQLFPVSPAGRRSGLEGKADLLGLATQRGRTPYRARVSDTAHAGCVQSACKRLFT